MRSRITVLLRGTVKDERRPGGFEFDISENSEVATVSQNIGLPEGTYLYIVNGSMARLGVELKDGDTLEIYGQMAGG